MLGSLSPMWETQIDFQDPGFNLAQPCFRQLGSEPAYGRPLSTCLSVYQIKWNETLKILKNHLNFHPTQNCFSNSSNFIMGLPFLLRTVRRQNLNAPPFSFLFYSLTIPSVTRDQQSCLHQACCTRSCSFKKFQMIHTHIKWWETGV